MTRRPQCTALLALLLMSCGARLPDPPRQASAAGQVSEAPQEPLAISLRAIKGPGLEAVMSNRSSTEQVLLHDGHLQDCRLVLVDGSGQEVESFDERRIMKFDTTPYRYLFETLAPGEGIVIHDDRFLERDGGGWEMDWGPHRFAEIAAGTYAAHVQWTSEITAWFDTQAQQHEQLEGIWTGTVRSNEVTVTLP